MTALGKSFEPSELEFLSEETMIRITPLIDLDRIDLITVRFKNLQITSREVTDHFFQTVVQSKYHCGLH